MALVDDKVVAMSFESGKFESGVSSTISALDKLKNALKFSDAGKGLDGVTKAAQGVDLSHISNGVDAIKSKLSAMHVAAVAIFASLAAKAVSVGANFVKQFTVAPVIDGLHEYEQQLNSVQTILANTKSAGTNLQDVNKALNQLNHYADKTIYNFSQMTKNIGTFTAAGVDLKTSVTSIKGIANLAALSGSNAEQASTAMYQLSQAISAGRVSLQDWNSVVNAGMGGTVFQRALAQNAVKMGTLNDSAVKLSGAMKNVTINGESFRQSIQAGPGKQSWLTSKVLTQTLSQFSGDLTNAQLKAEGFNDAEIKAIQTQSKMALNAATQVKTFSQLLDTTKEAVGSGWAQTWQIILGNFGQAKTLFTSLSNIIGGFVNTSANARNNVLKDWAKLGGRTNLIAGIGNVFKALGAVIKPIHDAFREIFPAKTGKDLADATQRFKDFTNTLKPSPQTVENLKRTFAGLFAVLDIGKQIVGGIFHVIGQLLGAIFQGSGSVLNFTGNIGDFLVSLDQAIKKGDSLKNFFNVLGTVLTVPIHLLGVLKTVLSNLFSGVSGSAGALSGLSSGLNPLQSGIQAIAHAWNAFITSFSNSDSTVRKTIDAIGQMFGSLGTAIANAIQNTDFSVVFAAINTGLIAGILVVLKKFTTGGFLTSFGGGILKNISGSFGALTGSLEAMQKNIQAGTLQKIAIAIGILAASMIGLSLVDPKKMNNALTAITIGFAQLLGAMKIMDKITSSGGFIKMPILAVAMIGLAAAIDILALAVAGLGQLSWNSLIKGLTGVGALLLGISAASGPLSANSAGLIKAGVGITAIGIAMNILALAVKQFGGMSMGELAKGLLGVSVALSAIALASKLFPPSMPALGVGLIAVGTGLKIIASAVGQFGGMDWSAIGKGLVGIGGALVIIAGAMQIMPKGMVLQAAALIGVAAALQLIAKAVNSFGGMSVGEIAKGLIALGGSLLILAGGLAAMSGSLGGAAALTVASAGLALLAPALESLGKQSWGQIVKGLISLAAALAVMAVASVALAPAAGAMLAMGAALLAIGGGLALAGAGIFLVGTGLSAIAVAGPAAIDILVHALVKLTQTIPQMVQGFVQGLAELATQLAQNAPKFLAGISAIIGVILQAIIQNTPKIAQAFTVLLTTALQTLRNNFPLVLQTGIDLLIQLLNGIANNIGQVTAAAVNVVVQFVGAIGSQIGRVIDAGVNLVSSLVQAIVGGMGKVISSAITIVVRFVETIANNIGKVINAGVSILTHLIDGISSVYSKIIDAGGNAIIHFIGGVGSKGAAIVSAAASAAGKFINAIASATLDMVDKGAQAIIRFMNGVADAIKKYEPQMIQAGFNIGIAIVQGMINGVAKLGPMLLSKIGDLVKSLPDKALKLLHIGSPSKVFADIGMNIVRGLTLGISSNGHQSVSAIEDMISAMTESFTSIPDILDGLIDIEPTITPVLDLSNIQAGAQKMSGLIATTPVVAATSSGQASAISATQPGQQPADSAQMPGSTTLQFQQNNYSPAALSEIDIYRQTKNQLSLVKAALEIPG